MLARMALTDVSWWFVGGLERFAKNPNICDSKSRKKKIPVIGSFCRALNRPGDETNMASKDGMLDLYGYLLKADLFPGGHWLFLDLQSIPDSRF